MSLLSASILLVVLRQLPQWESLETIRLSCRNPPSLLSHSRRIERAGSDLEDDSSIFALQGLGPVKAEAASRPLWALFLK